MDDLINNIQMFFHPLLEIDRNHVDSKSILNREKIRVLTYNIFLRPPPVKNNDNDWKDERMVDFIKHLENYDIICLQEMFGSLTSRREALIKYASRSGLFFHVDVPSPSFFSKNIIDGGLLILSRFPIVESEFRPFKYTVLSCSVVEKGILYSKIKIKDSHIAIFNVHLQATYFDVSKEQWDLCTKTRLSHVQEISEFVLDCIINRKLTNEDRILLMGDFNIDAHGLKHKVNKIDDKGNVNKFEFELLDEYSFLIQKFNENFYALDLIKNKFSSHPFTYGITHYTHSNTELNCLHNFETKNNENEKNSNDGKYKEELSNLSLEENKFSNSARTSSNSFRSESSSGKKYDMVLTDKSDIGSMQSLDYIFEIFISQNDFLKKEKNNILNVNYDSVQVEEFLVENKPYQQLSDHFGVSFEMSYRK